MPPNVLLIIVDSLRAANLSLYGHRNETTPFLERFSDEAVVYTQARAPGTWSLPSHASIFTGFHVEEHQLTSRKDRLRPGHTIWETLRDEHGYRTGVFSRNPFVTRDSYGLQHGFQTIKDITDIPLRTYPFRGGNPDEFRGDGKSGSESYQYIKYCIAHERPVRTLANGIVRKIERGDKRLLPGKIRTHLIDSAREHVDTFLKWQDEQTLPWAACINLIDVHHPYRPLPEFDKWGRLDLQERADKLDDHRWDFIAGRRPWWLRSALESLYDGTIHQVDAAIERLIDELQGRRILDDTLVVITSDHGEGFGEPSRLRQRWRAVGHEAGIHEVLLHVPLIVQYPHDDEPRTIEKAASLTRFPQVIETMLRGERVNQGFVPDGPVIASTDHDRRYEASVSNFDAYRDELDLSFFTGSARAIYQSDEDRVIKYATWDNDSAGIESVDPQSSMRVNDGNRRLVEDIFRGIDCCDVRESGQRVEMDSEAYRQLRSLGYV